MKQLVCEMCGSPDLVKQDSISPTLVKWFGHTEWFKKMWRGKLDRMVYNLKANGIKDTPYEDRIW